MIVALLVLIALVLLFGAGVVKGVLANAAGYGCGGLAIILALTWVGSFFGEDGPMWVFGIVMTLLIGLGLYAKAIEP